MRVCMDGHRLELWIEGDGGDNIKGEAISSESEAGEGLKDGKKR